MKVVAFNGSARKNGNTAILLTRVLKALKAEGIETELIQLARQQIHGCTAFDFNARSFIALEVLRQVSSFSHK